MRTERSASFKKRALKFTPLEFETFWVVLVGLVGGLLKFTPLEFETLHCR